MIEKGRKVTLDYTLTVDGQIVESSQGKTPLEYTHGENMIIPGLEYALEGLKTNDMKKVVVKTEEGYGARDDARVIDVPRSNLSNDLNPEPGMVLQLQTQNGQTLQGIVVGQNDDAVRLDFNHPLAGKELTFDITIVDVQ